MPTLDAQKCSGIVADETARVTARTKNRLVIAAKALIATALLVWLVASGRLDLSDVFGAGHPLLQAAGTALLLASMLLQYVRWWLLLRAVRIEMSLRQSMEISFIGQFAAGFLPGGAGGELARMYYVARDFPLLAGGMTIVVDRALGFWTLLCFSTFGFAIVGKSHGTAPLLEALSAATIVVTVGAFFVFFRRTREALVRVVPKRWRSGLSETVGALVADKAAIVCSVALSFAATLLVIVAFSLCAQAAESGATFLKVSAAAPVSMIVAVLPISPGGIGVAEAAGSVAFSRLGVAKGATMVAIFRLWYLVLSIPGAVLYVIRSRGARRRE